MDPISHAPKRQQSNLSSPASEAYHSRASHAVEERSVTCGMDLGFQLSRSGKKQLAFSSMGRVPFPLFEKPGKQKVMIDD